MWISRKKYDRLVERLDKLEAATWCSAGSPDTQVGRVVKMILDHLGLLIERPMPYDRLVKKGGPERGQE